MSCGFFLKKVFELQMKKVFAKELQMTEKRLLMCRHVLLKPIIWFSVFQFLQKTNKKRFDRISKTVGDERSKF